MTVSKQHSFIPKNEADLKVIKPQRFISKDDIELYAQKIIMRVQEKRKKPIKWPLDVGHLAEYLGLDMDCGEIPADEEGAIAAMILPTECKIIINENNQQLSSGFEASTIAHEIGHWILHINQEAVRKFVEMRNRGVDITVEPFLCRSANTQKGIEWQAQYFAGCLLMPKFKLEEVQRGRDLTKWKHLYAIKDELGVTISNLTNRLQDLSWINIPKNSKQIYLGKVLRNE